MSDIKSVIEIIVQIVVILGVPTALYRYFRATKKEQEDREYGTYNALDEKFLEFQKFCLEYPALDVFGIPNANVPNWNPIPLTQEQEKQQLIAFTILLSIFERAYLMYLKEGKVIKQRQWEGWVLYIQDFCKRENFRKAWVICGNMFDTAFEKFMIEDMKLPPPHESFVDNK